MFFAQCLVQLRAFYLSCMAHPENKNCLGVKNIYTFFFKKSLLKHFGPYIKLLLHSRHINEGTCRIVG
jgi:hypothetical protein